MAPLRTVFFYFFIGINRTGKSMTARQYALEWVINNPDGIVVGYDPQSRFKDLIHPAYKLSAGEKGWWAGNEERERAGRRPISEVRRALFIADDMKGLNETYTTMSDLGRLMEFRAEYAIDIIFIVHNPGFVLNGISMYVDNWFIFYTRGKHSNFEDKIETYEECTKAAEIMRAYVEAYPSIMENPGQFYDSSNHGNHKFPHMIVNANTRQLIPQNIYEPWLENYLSKIN